MITLRFGHRRRWGVAQRAALVAVCLVGFVASGPAPASADPPNASHGLSAFGALKYPADFKHFDYVNPAAPKGGRMSMIGTSALTTFDSFNPFILKGDPAQGLSLLFDSLMVRAEDEPDAVYGLVAETAALATDRTSITFKLRTSARFADGTPVTADDIVFTFNTLKEKGHPAYRIQLRDVVACVAPDPLTVRYEFVSAQARDLPSTVAALPILSKAYYAGRPFEETTLEAPLGSGPYKIGDHKQGAFVAYQRRGDYWAADLPVNRGRYNFDELRYEYYRDRTAELENLKNGQIDLREEFTSKDWATAYDIPAVVDGRLIRRTMPDNRPSGAQGFFMNTRRAKFADVRVRKALDLIFDFEWTNKNLFYGLYTRTSSYFENSPMKASSAPTPEERALLEPFAKDLPATVFGDVYVPPVSDGTGNDRRLLREAGKLLADAGWRVVREGDGLRNAEGQPFEIEFLTRDPTSERLISPYADKLKSMGFAATIRRVDPAQYERRAKSFDFDIVISRFTLRLTPGTEMRNYLSSEAAATDGSLNLAGVRSPAVDGLVTRMLESKTRDELNTAAHALDRVLRASHYWVPHWYKAVHNIAHWDKFSMPATKPLYDPGVIDTWWYDATKAAKLMAK